MANVQKENGFTGTANELVEAFCGLDINGGTHRVLRFIERKTYGFNKKRDMISFSQFVKVTKLNRRTVIRCIKELEKLNVIFVDRGTYIPTYEINKNYDTWGGGQQTTGGQVGTGGVVKRAKTSGQQTTHNINKENNKIGETSSPLKDKETDMPWKPKTGDDYEEGFVDFDGDGSLKEEPDEKKESNQKVTALLEWGEKIRGKKFLDRPTQRKMLHTLRVNKISPTVIKDTFTELLHSEYWKGQDRLPDFKTVVSTLKNKK